MSKIYVFDQSIEGTQVLNPGNERFTIEQTYQKTWLTFLAKKRERSDAVLTKLVLTRKI